MSLFRRRPEVELTPAEGFHATDAPALQRSILAALGMGESPRAAVVPARMRVERGADDRLVLVWNNVIVGFVPPSATAAIAAEVARAGDALVVVRTVVHRPARDWRVWVGDVPTTGVPPVPDGLDTLAVPETTVLGVPVRRLDARG